MLVNALFFAGGVISAVLFPKIFNAGKAFVAFVKSKFPSK